MAKCGCGIPSKANYYVEMILTKDVPGGTDTVGKSKYCCEDHLPDARDVSESLVNEGWSVVKYDEKRLR